jgi:hypothetical protein
MRVADQGVPEANASYATGIAHERSGTQPAEASAPRPRASILRPTSSRSLRSATYNSGPNPDFSSRGRTLAYARIALWRLAETGEVPIGARLAAR